jgi:hypothetical protein
MYYDDNLVYEYCLDSDGDKNIKTTVQEYLVFITSDTIWSTVLTFFGHLSYSFYFFLLVLLA